MIQVTIETNNPLNLVISSSEGHNHGHQNRLVPTALGIAIYYI